MDAPKSASTVNTAQAERLWKRCLHSAVDCARSGGVFNLFFASVLTLVFVLGWRPCEEGYLGRTTGVERASTTGSGLPHRTSGKAFAKLHGGDHDASPMLSSPSSGDERRIRSLYRGLPLFFEPNAGQVGNDGAQTVNFVSRGPGYTIFLTSDGAVLTLTTPRASGKAEKASGSVLRMHLVGGNTQTAAAGMDELDGKSNYFFGSDPANWHTNVANYGRVRYRDVYPGVDLAYYGNHTQLEYDFIVAAGADPAPIRLELAIAGGRDRGLQIAPDGDLVVRTAAGPFRFAKPVAFQIGSTGTQSRRRRVDVRYRLFDHANQVGFALGDYDRARPLIIDPVLSYSTFLGGTEFEQAYGIAVDGSGNAYVTGCTGSVDFPVTSGVFQSTSAGGGECDDTGDGGGPLGDVFVTKLNPEGTGLLYSTYLGGSGRDQGTAIAIDSSGDAYITGQTYSSNFPVTTGAFDTACNACASGGSDAFIAKLNPTGSELIYSTFLGGSAILGDEGNAIAVDSSGNGYVTGLTNSNDFPTTPGAFKTTCNCSTGNGNANAFVTKLNPTGTGLVYSTYLGGTYPPSTGDPGNGIVINASGDAYVTGEATSYDFPVTQGAFETTRPGNAASLGYITEMNASGSGLIYSTYLGGSFANAGQAIALDGSGNAYVTGSTGSTDFPVTPGAFQTFCTGLGGCDDSFVTKLNSTGSALVYSTFLGGTAQICCQDSGSGIGIDSAGDAYVSGVTYSSNFPTTSGAYKSQCSGTCLPDGYLTELNPTGTASNYSTYFGGTGPDGIYHMAIDTSGNVYLAGETGSANFPVTPGAFQPTCSGGCQPQNPLGPPVTDSFISKFSFNQQSTSTGVVQTTDFYGDGKSDAAIWRPSTGTWYVKSDGNNSNITQLQGETGDVPVSADYDGDGTDDFAIWRPSTATWYILEAGGTATQQWGSSDDVPVPADYDGDGKSDIAVWRPATGTWYVLPSNGGGTITKQYGQAGDVPVTGDYDGDGKADYAVFRPSNGTWYVILSSTGKSVNTPYGSPGDIPAEGDYDGDGKTDYAVWRPSNGTWYVLLSSTGKSTNQQYGTIGDVPVVGDYNGDGKNDYAVFRPSNGTWYIEYSSGGSETIQYGETGDIPATHLPSMIRRDKHIANFDGDRKTDIGFFRPSTGTWYVIDSSTGKSTSQAYGTNGDLIVPGDYDGDGKTDYAVWRPSNQTWYVLSSSTGTSIHQQWGASGDIPVPGDYDGDGKTDYAVFRPSDGSWHVILSSTGKTVIQSYGTTGDIPVPSDYDGDGVTDYALWRPSNQTWYVLLSSTGVSTHQQLGASGDIPLPGDYDGDTKADYTVFRPSNGTWYTIQSSSGKTISTPFGTNGDVPVAKDYDGDEKTDIAVFRPSSGTWYILQSSNGQETKTIWGVSTDVPTNRPTGQ